MRRRDSVVFRTLLVFLFVLVGTGPLAPQSVPDTLLVSVSARVVNSVTAAGVPGTVVRIQELGVAVVSDSTGHFSLDLIPAGEHRVSVVRAGFRAAEGNVSIERDGSLLFHLTPQDAMPAGGTGPIRGRVIAEDTGEPLSSAMVRLPDLGEGRLTDGRGWFNFPSVPFGVHDFEVEHIGYSVMAGTVTLRRGEMVDVSVVLSVDPVALEGITITARPRWLTGTGFFRRQESANAYSGRQWTREELEARNPVFIQDILTTAPGIQLRADYTGKSALYGRKRCKLAVYIDDMLVPDFNLEALNPDWIEALEVYHGSSNFMPVEYGQKHCGVVLIWLKRDRNHDGH